MMNGIHIPPHTLASATLRPLQDSLMQSSSPSSGAQPTALGPAAGIGHADGLASVMDRVVFLKQLQQVSNWWPPTV
jgi:hypothetical protein